MGKETVAETSENHNILTRLSARENVIEFGVKFLHIVKLLFMQRSTRWRSWLRYCATSRKVVGSIPDGVIGIFH